MSRLQDLREKMRFGAGCGGVFFFGVGWGGGVIVFLWERVQLGVGGPGLFFSRLL